MATRRACNDKLAAPNMISAERREFLNADYRIVRKVADLPAGIRKLYTVKGGSRVAIADPGEKFEATDVISDPDLPTRRLIFAGVAQDRVFIHYEEGGIAPSYIVELFRLESPDIAVGDDFLRAVFSRAVGLFPTTSCKDSDINKIRW